MGLVLDKISNKKSKTLTGEDHKEAIRKEEKLRKEAEVKVIKKSKKKNFLEKGNVFATNFLSATTAVIIIATALVCFLKLIMIYNGSWIDILAGCVLIVVLTWFNEKLG